MRLIFSFLLAAGAALPQGFSFGLKLGAATTDLTRPTFSANGSYSPEGGRSVIGPTVELRLPFHLAVEFDALRRPLEYRLSGTTAGSLETLDLRAAGSQWEFPLLAKYRFGGAFVSPFVVLGPAWNHVGLTQTGTTRSPLGATRTVDTDNPPELASRSVSGVVVGGGLEGHLPILRIAGELRYTRWRDDNLVIPGGSAGISRRNQLEALVGITF